MITGPDPGMVAEWAIPGLIAGVLLAAFGVSLYVLGRREPSDFGGFALLSVLCVGVVTMTAYSLMSSSAIARSGWGELALSSCCASPGLGILLAGAGWAAARPFRRKRARGA